MSVSEVRRWPAGDQARPERPVVLDDAVMDDGDPPRAVQVGMGVPIRGHPVGGPAGVGDPQGPVDRGVREVGFQLGDLALGLPDAQTPPVHHGQPRGVVAPVLQPLQAREEDLGRAVGADVADDAAHRQ